MGGGERDKLNPASSSTPGPYGTPPPSFGSVLIGSQGLPPDDPDYQSNVKGKDLQDIWNKANSILIQNPNGDPSDSLRQIGVDPNLFPMRTSYNTSPVSQIVTQLLAIRQNTGGYIT